MPNEVVQNDAVPVAEAEVFQFDQEWRVGQCHVRKKQKPGSPAFEGYGVQVKLV